MVDQALSLSISRFTKSKIVLYSEFISELGSLDLYFQYTAVQQYVNTAQTANTRQVTTDSSTLILALVST